MIIWEYFQHNQQRLRILFPDATRLPVLAGVCDQSFPPPSVLGRCEESQEQGWHEAVDAAASYLHKTLQQKEGRIEVGAAPLVMPADTHKLKRHVGLLLEKVLKAGAKIGDSVNRSDAHGREEDRAAEQRGNVLPECIYSSAVLQFIDVYIFFGMLRATVVKIQS